MRPAAAFCALSPSLPLPLPLRLALLFPPRLEDPGELAIAAARDLLIPFLRSPSYRLSFFTLGPWSLASVHLLKVGRYFWEYPFWISRNRCPAARSVGTSGHCTG